jgi:molybdate transport system substrate-binding protein
MARPLSISKLERMKGGSQCVTGWERRNAMRSASIQTAFAVVALAFGGITAVAGAAEITVLSSIGLQSVLEDLAPKFENSTGHKLSLTFGLAGPFAKRVQDGEAVDILVAPRGFIDGLIKANKLESNSETNLARSSVGIAVRKGAPKPDISTPEALKRALLAARSISYTNPAFGGASGVHFAKVIERLGIAEEMKAKTKFPPQGGFTAPLLASGEVDLAVQQIGELISVPGVELLGPLPGDLQSVTTMTVAIPSAARQPEAARALIKYLQSPEATAVMKAKGLEPIAESR